MFSHLLVPTDGSELSTLAIKRAATFAKECGARITGFHAVEEPRSVPHSYASVGELKDIVDFPKRVDATARDYLAVIENTARHAGVECRTYYEIADKHPWEAIIDAAQKNGCDLIFMASHGRRGIDALLMGSETHKVLTHCKTPVLVFR